MKKEISEAVKELCKKGNIEYVFVTPECIYYSITHSKVLREAIKHLRRASLKVD